MTHTHTIESGNARVSVEADDAASAVSEARRNWALNNGGVVSDDIARRIAAEARTRLVKRMEAECWLEHVGERRIRFIDAVEQDFRELVVALIQRAEAAERERDTARIDLMATVQAMRAAAILLPAAKEGT